MTVVAQDEAHRPVMLDETLAGLAIREGGIYVDGTYGRGGHSAAMLAAIGTDGRLLALDRDPEAVADAQRLATDDDRFEIERCGFTMLTAAIAKRNWDGRVSGILLDLGVSSPQLDDPARGFSFLRDGPLDMRMDPDHGISAADWLATADQQAIARVLKVYGEERFAHRIARAIVARRVDAPLRTTAELAALITDSVPRPNPKKRVFKHPATRSFQAIRIFINGELEQLQQVLPQCLRALAPGGRLVVISFHSLEDRIVKRFIRDASRPAYVPREIPITADQSRPPLRLIGKAQRASEAELQVNPRARSAVLRVAERQAGTEAQS
jgi:16S rRNA (cytosine1402-N4)-methyltransferase